MSDIMTEDKHDLAVDWFVLFGDDYQHKNNFPNCDCLESLCAKK